MSPKPPLNFKSGRYTPDSCRNPPPTGVGSDALSGGTSSELRSVPEAAWTAVGHRRIGKPLRRMTYAHQGTICRPIGDAGAAEP